MRYPSEALLCMGFYFFASPQALLLEDLPSSHSTFQGYAAHTARWPAMLRPKGLWGACTPQGLIHSSLYCASRRRPVYPKVLLHFFIMLHGAAQAIDVQVCFWKATRPA